jgi:5-methylcytosine-specific restriction protein A
MPKLTKFIRRIETTDINRAANIAVSRITGGNLRKTRRRIAIRDQYTCQRCGAVVAHFEIDHIVPLFLGGSDSDINRQLLCVSCHKEKSDEEGKEHR